MAQTVQDIDFWWRILIALILITVLTLFIHTREVRVESIQVDQLAKNYIIAQVDFTFPDEATTAVTKQEAIREISTIYSLDPREIKKEKNFFRKSLVRNDDWKRLNIHASSTDINSILDLLENYLLHSRFTDERTLRRIQEIPMPIREYYVCSPRSNQTSLPGGVWNNLQEVILSQISIDPVIVDYIIHFYRNIEWRLSPDPLKQREIMQAIEAFVPIEYTNIKSGYHILSQGDRITSRHVAMVQAMKKALTEQRNLWHPVTIFGSLLFASLVVIISSIYFKKYEAEFWNSLDHIILFSTVIIFLLLAAKGIEYLLVANTTKLQEIIRYPIFTPFAGVLLCVLISPSIAFYAVTIVTILMGVSLAIDHDHFVMINFITGLVAILFSQSLRRRKEMFAVMNKVWLSALSVVIGFHLLEGSIWSSMLLIDIFTTLGFTLLITILILGLLPVLESLFHSMTNITLMEYMDPSTELLKKLSIEAPGTYQHCLVVGTLAESAAQSIGANGLFCRVATLYHDIGKLNNPHYFTENQTGDFNIHQLLTPIESTQVILSHVSDGCMMAKKYKLPSGFIDVIREHHGTTLVYYFYAKQLEMMGGDAARVDEMQFRYPGPRPKTKESAIIMIADKIEAASRSMEEITQKNLTNIVDRLINDKIKEGQFDDCKLTFEELGIVKKSIINTLIIARHLRVKYPEKT
ncbi:MAG: HD family phosphohydrolase [Chlamydiales bacterium]